MTRFYIISITGGRGQGVLGDVNGISASALNKPLPKPRRDAASYVSARVLEALLEGLLALEFLERGFTRNAAGKAFQAWKALTAALLALERDVIAERLDEEQRKWLFEKAIPRVPTSRLKPLAGLIEEVNYPHYSAYTAVALDLHDYQYHGPDPDLEFSKYSSPEEAVSDTLRLLRRIVEIVRERVKHRLENRGKWTERHEEAIRMLTRALAAPLRKTA